MLVLQIRKTMVAKRKRAKGGGRKPKGEFSELTSPLSIRMPQVLRGELERAARESGKSVSQELLRRLSDTFYRDKEKARDPAMRALCFLIAEAARQAVGIPVSDRLKSKNALNWRNNPFFFRAFKIAVGNLLDALEPKGSVEAPKLSFHLKPTTAKDGTALGGAVNDFIQSYETPEARGHYAANYIWNSLQTIPHFSPEEREREIQRLMEISSPAFEREFYGMAEAARDLRINDEEKKT
jgi:hypothetical protein